MNKTKVEKAKEGRSLRERGNPPLLTAHEHERLMQRMGISKDQDEK